MVQRCRAVFVHRRRHSKRWIRARHLRRQRILQAPEVLSSLRETPPIQPRRAASRTLRSSSLSLIIIACMERSTTPTYPRRTRRKDGSSIRCVSIPAFRQRRMTRWNHFWAAKLLAMQPAGRAHLLSPDIASRDRLRRAMGGWAVVTRGGRRICFRSFSNSRRWHPTTNGVAASWALKSKRLSLIRVGSSL